MDWSNERYVRLYTRDTAWWSVLPWEARSLWMFLLRKMDRSGVMDLGKYGTRGIAAAVGMPIELVEKHLPTLLEDGCLVLEGDRLRVPNYIAANETPSSHAERQRAYRERSRSKKRNEGDEDVTNRHGHGTKRHKNETARDAVSLRAVPYRAVPKDPSDPSSEVGDLRPSKPIPVQAIQVAENIAKHVLALNPGAAKLRTEEGRRRTVESWADSVRLLHERDGRPWEEIAAVWRWARDDAFWSANVLSGQTLRKQFDRLVVAMKRPAHTNGRRPSPPQPQLLDLGAVPAVEEARRKGTP